MKEKVALKGYVIEDNGDYNFITSLAGGEKFNHNQLLGIALEEISDKKFNKLLIEPARVEIKLETKMFNMSIFGRILGGGDPTKPIRHQGKKIRPRQSLTILLEEKLDDEISKMLNKEAVKLIVCD